PTRLLLHLSPFLRPPPPSPPPFPYTTLFRSPPSTASAATKGASEPAGRSAGAMSTSALPASGSPAPRSGGATRPSAGRRPGGRRDRKSTRLNSSHQIISYAVFCLKKKTTAVC